MGRPLAKDANCTTIVSVSFRYGRVRGRALDNMECDYGLCAGYAHALQETVNDTLYHRDILEVIC